MIKEFKNTLLKQTTNKAIKKLEGQKGILTVYEDEDKIIVTFSINKQKIEIPVEIYIGNFSKLFFGEAYIEGTDGNDYLFGKERKNKYENIC